MIRVSFWTAVFLILLRVCIGWHFFFEGYGKVKSAYQGTATVNDKPFSSETYFRESEGPFGKVVKQWMGDPDQELIDKLTLKEVEGDSSQALTKNLIPDKLNQEWDEYFARFTTTFKLDDSQKTAAQTKLDQSKAGLVLWLRSLGPEDQKTKKNPDVLLKIKRKSPTGAATDFEQEMTLQTRVAEFKKKSNDVKVIYAEKLPMLGKDVEGAKLRAMKSEVASIRAELQKELDAQTNKMKDSLADVLTTRIATYAKQLDNKSEIDTLMAMLTPMSEGNNPLGKMWDAYADYAKEFSPDLTESHKAQIAEQLKQAKEGFDQWLVGPQRPGKTPKPGADVPPEQTPKAVGEVGEVAEWRASYDAATKNLAQLIAAEKALPKNIEKPNIYQRAVEEEVKARLQDAQTDLKLLTSQMQANLKQKSDALKNLLGSTLGDVRAKGYATADDSRILGFIPKMKPVEYIDWSTRWFLLVVGALLMLGLFTRLSCFSAAVFLVLTILTQPSLPWLPVAPNNEGNYLFVNKNVIEMLALFALMTTRSGKWCGLDGILESIFKRA